SVHPPVLPSGSAHPCARVTRRPGTSTDRVTRGGTARPDPGLLDIGGFSGFVLPWRRTDPAPQGAANRIRTAPGSNNAHGPSHHGLHPWTVRARRASIFSTKSLKSR